MKKLNTCPVCEFSDISLILDFSQSVTSDSHLVFSPVHNRFCKVCGFIFNASGVRGQEESFYSDKYNLLVDAPDAEFMYESNRGRSGINDEMVDFIKEHLNLPQRGHLLEIGSGKGVFLTRFHRAFPKWQIAAVEPSANARSYLSERLEGIEVHEGTFETSPFRNQKYDFVVSIGVLEHIAEPLPFLGALARTLSPDGAAMIAVPNFEYNPCDLLTFDHLNRFTPTSLCRTLALAGLETKMVHSGNRIPMWAIAHPSVDAENTTPSFEEMEREWVLATSCARWVKEALAVYNEIGRTISGPERRLGIYGAGILALVATELTAFSVSQITCLFDDNPLLSGGSRLERTILPLAEWEEQGVTDLTFSANPCYLPRMIEKATAICKGRARIWKLPDWEFATQIKSTPNHHSHPLDGSLS